MPRRAPQTLADYMVVGISPALVMFMVGSLVWFLTIVFYQGDYTWRLLMVHACFVMGAVATTRLAMEEGAAYASIFGFVLAVVVAIAYISFVKVEGALAAFSPIINLGLEGVIWFSAYKLTWDCTLIDDTQDSSKQGLLQAMGWDRVEGEIAPRQMTNDQAPMTNDGSPDPTDIRDHRSSPSAEPGDLEATTSREVEVFNWLRSFFVPDKRPHTPGVWIIYFSLAALPLFGIGQWFIPADQLELRRDAFWLLVVYVACGLGLLLNTSFLGLRRYLRQRNLLMPTEMAATWLGVGVTMIVAVLVLVYLLPRPSAEYSVSQLDMFKSKPLDPSRWGWGKDGAKQPSSQQSSTKASGEGGQESDKAQSSKSGKSKNQSSGKGKGSKDGSGQGDQGKSSKGGKEQGGKSSGGKGTGKDKSSDGAKSPESGSDSQKGDGKSGDNSDSKSGKSKAFDKDDSQKSDGKNDSSQQGGDDQSSDQESQSSQDASQESSSSDSESTSSSEESPESDSSSDDSSSSSQLPPSSFHPTQWLSTLSPTLAQIIQWLFYALVIVTLIVLAWIYRAQIIAAWKKLVAELRDLWARWFGGKQAAEFAEIVPPSAPPRPFATYSDPFASGLAGRATLAELVRYTFEALEAWGREHNSPRATGQTAHEYAQQVGQVHEPLAGEVRFLAELYGQLAYAQSSARQANVEPLKSLWQQMRLASGGV